MIWIDLILLIIIIIPRSVVSQGAGLVARRQATGWRRIRLPPPWRWNRSWRPTWQRWAGRRVQSQRLARCCQTLPPPSRPACRGHATHRKDTRYIWPQRGFTLQGFFVCLFSFFQLFILFYSLVLCMLYLHLRTKTISMLYMFYMYCWTDNKALTLK